MTAELELARRYEAQLDPTHPTAGELGVTIIGYGEISAVLRFAEQPGVVFKRMAGFRTAPEVEGFTRAIGEYCDALRGCGVNVISTECHGVTTPRNGNVVYLVQPAVPADHIGNAVVKTGTDDEVRALLRAVLASLEPVYRANAKSNGVSIGVDAQISNWAWPLAGPGTGKPLYIDVGAPFMRRDGREIMDWEVMVRALPGPMRWYMRNYELQGVLDRYHKLKITLIDIAGNIIKEGRADRVPLMLEEFSHWLQDSAADLGTEPPTAEEVERYYSADAKIWTYVLAARKLDRFVQTHLFRGNYPHVLPGKIARR